MSIANRKKYGVRKMLNITMVFKCSFQFPVFFKLFSLKYAFTREFNVLKNFKLSLVENVELKNDPSPNDEFYGKPVKASTVVTKSIH